MRWLKRTISTLMLLAAAGIALAIAFSNHSDDYGRVSLPQGGTVHLPKGKVIVFDRLNASTSDLDQASAAIRFQVQPAGGGQPVGIKLDNGQVSEFQVERSETIGELGAIGKLDVPAAGDYRVSGSSDLARHGLPRLRYERRKRATRPLEAARRPGARRGGACVHPGAAVGPCGGTTRVSPTGFRPPRALRRLGAGPPGGSTSRAVPETDGADQRPAKRPALGH